MSQSNPKKEIVSRQLQNLKRLGGYLLRFKSRIFFSVSILLLSKGLAVTGPYLLKRIIDGLTATSALEQSAFLFGLVGLYFLVSAGTSIFDGAKDYIFSRAESTIKKLIALDIFKHLLELSVDFHTNRATGGVARKIFLGTTALEMAMFFVTANIIPTLVQIVLIIIVFLTLFPPSFSLALILFVIIYVAFTIYIAE